MQQFVGTSLKTRLYLLVLAAFIPVAVLIFYIAEEQKAIETAAILHKTMVLAQAAANEENQQIASTRDLLTVVADAFLATESRAERLSGLLTHLARQSKGYADVGIVGPDGSLLAGSDPAAAGRDYSDRPWFSTSRQQGILTMGPYHGEHIDGEPVLYLALPARDNRGQTLAVAFAALNLNWMNRAIFKQLTDLPKGSRLTLLDETQSMLRYDVDAGQWSVPQNFDPVLLARMVQRESGILQGVDENRITRIYAFAPLISTFRSRRISVVLGIPQQVALTASRHLFTRNVVLLALSALTAVLSIWWAADIFILRRVQAMTRASRKLAAGDLNARIGRIGARDELSHLAGVFDEMAAALQMRIGREARAMASLEQSREQLRNLAAHQQEVREQERIRIAREIHDQLGQSLTILNMDLSWLKKHMTDQIPPVAEKMGVMSRTIDEALKSLHAVTAELRPVILDDFGLAAAIEWQAEAFRNHSGINCRLENRGYEPDLPKDQATALFRIFQEILTNIMRHAKADDVVVRLEARDGELMLQVQDNGRGITEAEINAPRSFGLLGIRERLHPFNGRVLFEGQPGQGTCVTIHLPMPMEGEPQ